MSRLFELEDQGLSDNNEKKNPQQRFDIEDSNIWKMEFDKEATQDIETLKNHMLRAQTKEDVVLTALELLALALNHDVLIESKFKKNPKKVSKLWRH